MTFQRIMDEEVNLRFSLSADKYLGTGKSCVKFNLTKRSCTVVCTVYCL